MTTNYINPVLGNEILVQIGDGATPTEVFSHPNLINTTRGLTFSTATETDELIDLNDPSAPAQTIRRVKSSDLKVDGAGMLPKSSTKTYMDWVSAGSIKNIKITEGSWIVTGPFVLTSFQITGDRLKSSTCTLTLEQAGPVTVTAAP